jgi:membrane protein
MNDNALINIFKQIKPFGFAGLSIYDVTIFFIKGLQEGAITTRASSLAFNFFLAFFPSIIVFFTLIPYIPLDGFQETLMEILSNILPPSTNAVTFETLDDIINNQRGGLLSIGFILALFFSANGMSSLIQAFNTSYHIRENKSIIGHQILSIVLTVILSLIVFLTIILIIFGKGTILYLIEYQIIGENKILLLNSAKWVILITMLFVGITTLFNFGPAIKSKIKIFSPGAILATLFIIITSIAFSYYIDNFSQYNKIYGSIGTLIIILLWIYFNAIILLTGFELDASIYNAQKNIKNKI